MSFLVLYVDDILLVGNDKNLLNSVKEYLNSKFSMKDLGEAAYILGINREMLLLSDSSRNTNGKISRVFRKT